MSRCCILRPSSAHCGVDGVSTHRSLCCHAMLCPCCTQAPGADHCHRWWRVPGCGRPGCQPVPAQHLHHQGGGVGGRRVARLRRGQQVHASARLCLTTRLSVELKHTASSISPFLSLSFQLPHSFSHSIFKHQPPPPPPPGPHHPHGRRRRCHWHQDSRQLQAVNYKTRTQEQVGHLPTAPGCAVRHRVPSHPWRPPHQQRVSRGAQDGLRQGCCTV